MFIKNNGKKGKILKSTKITFSKEVALVIYDNTLQELLYGILQTLDYAVIKIDNISDIRSLKKFMESKDFSRYICITDYAILEKFKDLRKYNNVLCIYTLGVYNLPVIKGKYISTEQLTIKEFRKVLNNEML